MQDAPNAFASTYQREVAFDEAEWRSRAASGACFLAYVDADVVGLAAGYHDANAAPHERELVSMWVDPRRRGAGVAAPLVEAVAQWARHDGATHLSLWVVDDNERARRLYERLGFMRTGATMPFPNDPDRFEERMTRPLG